MTSAVSLTVQALLAGSPQGISTAGTRVYPAPIAERTTLPAIAVSLAAEEEDRMLSGMTQYPLSVVHIECLAEDAKAAIELGEAVKLKLRENLTTYGGYNADFQKSGPDFTDFDDDHDTHRRLMAFDVRWRSTS